MLFISSLEEGKKKKTTKYQYLHLQVSEGQTFLFVETKPASSQEKKRWEER